MDFSWVDGKFAAAVAVALIPLFGVVGGFVSQTLIAGRNVYINSITSERSKWLEKLRHNLAAFNAGVSSMAFTHSLVSGNSSDTLSMTPADLRKSIDAQDVLASTLQLQLNPSGIIDGNVLEIVKTISRYQYMNEGRLINQLNSHLISHSQWLLKVEWEKVKFEARGFLHRFYLRNAEKERLRQYQIWTLNDGDFRTTVAALRERELARRAS